MSPGETSVGDHLKWLSEKSGSHFNHWKFDDDGNIQIGNKGITDLCDEKRSGKDRMAVDCENTNNNGECIFPRIHVNNSCSKTSSNKSNFQNSKYKQRRKFQNGYIGEDGDNFSDVELDIGVVNGEYSDSDGRLPQLSDMSNGRSGMKHPTKVYGEITRWVLSFHVGPCLNVTLTSIRQFVLCASMICTRIDHLVRPGFYGDKYDRYRHNVVAIVFLVFSIPLNRIHL